MESYWSKRKAWTALERRPMMSVTALALAVSGAVVTSVPRSVMPAPPTPLADAPMACVQDSEAEDEEPCCTVDKHFFRWPPWCVDVTITCECDGISGSMDIDNAWCIGD